ncbi:MAG: CBS domain-containing protein [bacterium]|nr:CBS domain-containing protein [bacterium]
MNILFFLTPKSEIEFAYSDNTFGEVIDILERSTYTAIPVINRKGEYKGTISEGDILWTLKNEAGYDMAALMDMKVTRIERKQKHEPVKVTAKVQDMFNRAVNQNFVPVTDDDDVFIGIVKRKDILQYYFQQENGNK